MIELPIYNQQGKQVDTLAIDEAQLGNEVRPALLKQAYVMFHANRRQGSARTKSRGMVDGSTRKLYRQKGTGRARAGTRRTVIRKGGGVAFAKTKTREAYRQKMPKKMRRLANRNALLAKLVDSEVKCIDDLTFGEPKTSAFRKVLDSLGVDRTCLVALGEKNLNAALSARNIPSVNTIAVQQLNAFELLNHRYLIVDKTSLQAFLDGTAWTDDESETKSGAAKKRGKKEAA
ncbi:MAG: 50S ribosomal protein L4 [Planctomycetes bacterium]|nr:50S ribosomal protein L4 [Planctomycetota bacterium]